MLDQSSASGSSTSSRGIRPACAHDQRHPLGEPARGRPPRARRGGVRPAQAGGAGRGGRAQHLPPGVVVRLEAADSVPNVAADSDKARQVLANLLDNAVKYSRTVARSRSAWRCAGGSSGSRSGTRGSDPLAACRIFEKFYRLDPNLTRGWAAPAWGSTSAASSSGIWAGASGSPRPKARLDLLLRAPARRGHRRRPELEVLVALVVAGS